MRASLQLALQVCGLLVFGAVLLAPLMILAKEKLPEEKRERKAEFRKGRLVELVKEPKGKGDQSTNEVWKTGREFRTMFDRKASAVKKGKGR